MMRHALGLIGGLLLASLISAPAYAKPPPVMVQVAYHFTTPNGAAKTFVQDIQLARAELATEYCDVHVPKSGKKIAKYLVTNFAELVGMSFQNANCVLVNGTIKMSSKPFGPPKQTSAAGVAMYLADGDGKQRWTILYDLRTPMSMSQCLQQIRQLTSEFKKKITKNVGEFHGTKFVKSKCAFVEGFKLWQVGS